MLESDAPDMTLLFEQLGLDSQPDDIEAFVAAHRPLAAGTELADAPFWSPAQSAFLNEAVERDGRWAIVVDDLDARLRA